MKYRSNYRRHRSHRISDKSQSESHRYQNYYLAAYTLNLTDRHGLNNKLFDLINTVIGSRKMNKIIDPFSAILEENAHKNTLKDIDYGFRDNRFLVLLNHHEKSAALTGEIVTIIQNELTHILHTGQSDRQLEQQIQHLQTFMKLEPIEVELIKFLYLCDQQPELLALFEERPDIKETVGIMADALNLRPHEVLTCLKFDSKLFKYNIIGRHGLAGPFILEDSILDFLSGLSSIERLAGRYYKISDQSEFKLKDFHLPENELKPLNLALKSENAQILLYGAPGTGKTQLARTLAKELGQKQYWLKHEKDDEIYRNRNTVRTDLLPFAADRAVNDNAVLIIDEADSILNSKYMSFFNSAHPGKGWLNDFLDNVSCRIIWISNHSKGIEASTARRFTYSLHFNNLDNKGRLQAWKSLTAKNRLKSIFSETYLEQLALTFEVNLAGIAGALKVAREFIQSTRKKGQRAERQEIKSLLENWLKKHQQLTTGKKPAARLAAIQKNYDRQALNTDADLTRLENSLQKWLNREKPGSGINLLLSGMPGTGKTEYVKYLSNELNRTLLIKRASDLLNPFVGMTEKLIAAAFREAEETSKILFIDEADSFFTHRENADKSWQVSQTNEFLNQLENHNTIAVFSTNFARGLDPATLRRLHYKVKFLPLNPEQKLRLFKLYFKNKWMRVPAEKQIHEIKKIPHLTPGDFRAVQARFDLIDEKLKVSDIITELNKEVSYKPVMQEKRVGF